MGFSFKEPPKNISFPKIAIVLIDQIDFEVMRIPLIILLSLNLKKYIDSSFSQSKP